MRPWAIPLARDLHRAMWPSYRRRRPCYNSGLLWAPFELSMCVVGVGCERAASSWEFKSSVGWRHQEVGFSNSDCPKGQFPCAPGLEPVGGPLKRNHPPLWPAIPPQKSNTPPRISTTHGYAWLRISTHCAYAWYRAAHEAYPTQSTRPTHGKHTNTPVVSVRVYRAQRHRPAAHAVGEQC